MAQDAKIGNTPRKMSGKNEGRGNSNSALVTIVGERHSQS